jgi:type II secretion system (T2SS) protein M
VNIKNRQQLLAFVAIAGVAILVADKLIIGPLWDGWKARSTRIAELKKSVTQGAVLLQREGAIRSRWDSMRTNTLPENISAAENEMLQAFERWSQDSRISVSSIKPQWKRAGDDFMTLECRADAFGSMQALTRFLYDMEKDPLALKVESVEITSRDNEGQQLSLALQVSGLLLSAETQ